MSIPVLITLSVSCKTPAPRLQDTARAWPLLLFCVVLSLGCRAAEPLPLAEYGGSWARPVDQWPTIHDLKDLTRERRAQGRPDPIQVEARFLSSGPYVKPALPVLGVKLVYAEGETEWFRVFCDRSGKGWHPSWDMVLTEIDGTPHGGQPFGPRTVQWFHGYTIASPDFIWGHEPPVLEAEFDRARLEPMELCLAQFRTPSSPGRYRVQAVYIGSGLYPGMDLDGKVGFKSEPLEFEWLPAPEPNRRGG